MALASTAAMAHSHQGAKAPYGDNTQRLFVIAQQMKSQKAGLESLVTEALTLCGFSIWPGGHSLTVRPQTNSPLHLAVDDTEIQDYSVMYLAGQGVALSDLEASLDYGLSQFSNIGVKLSCKPYIEKWLQSGPNSNDPAVRNLTCFLNDLEMSHAIFPSPAITQDSTLDPIQALLISRVFTEAIALPLRKAALKHRPSTYLVSRKPMIVDNPTPLPGWQEDLFVGADTNIPGALSDALDWGENAFGKYAKVVGNINVIASIVKFFEMYACLKGEFSVLGKGQPLVRTKASDYEGEVRTLSAKFYFDASANSNALKNARTYAAATGFDTDAPSNGPLANVECSWKFGQNVYYATKQIIQTAQGQPNPDRILTDKDGIAKLDVAGKPQFVKLDDATVTPVDRHVSVSVYPQLKGADAKQAMVDAMFTALGIKGGPVGAINIITEMMYRAKWSVAAKGDLQVTDWTPGEYMADVRMHVSLRALFNTVEASYIRTVERDLDVQRIPLRILPSDSGTPPTTLDPAILKLIPEDQRAKVLDALAKSAQVVGEANKANAGKTVFQAIGPGEVKMSVADNMTSRWLEGACGSPGSPLRKNETFSASVKMPVDGNLSDPGGNLFSLMITLDTVKKEARVVPVAVMNADHRLETTDPQGHTTPPVNDKQSVKITQDCDFKPDVNVSNGFVIPLQSSEQVNHDTDFTGSLTFPITISARAMSGGTIDVAGTLTVYFALSHQKKRKS